MRSLATLAAFILTVQGQALPSIRPQMFTLPNGLRVVLLEDHERPLVRARLHLTLDSEAATRPGLAPLALRVLRHSDAAAFRMEDFEQLLAGAGIELTSALRSDGLSWSLLARSRDQDLALGLLADRAFRSIVDPATLEAERLACWRETERLDASPRAKLRSLLEPDWTLQAPTLARLTAITYEDLLAFYARTLRPDRAVLVLQGDLGQEQAKRLVVLSFGTWTVQPPPPVPGAPTSVPAPAPTPASSPAAPSPEAQRIQVALAGAGLRAMAVAAEPEDLGVEAGALLALLLPGNPVLFPAQVTLEGQDLVAILDAEPLGSPSAVETSLRERLQTLRQRGFTEQDLDRARAAWLAGRALTSLHPGSMVDEALAEARGRAVTPEGMAAVTLGHLNEALRRWLDPARLHTGVVGGSNR
ncbi:M16 family metallopeptidase [Geothrix fuzhouensis]|uniref:M16 family metallopeptidase n=1 Tax=Geothrix fuzhouensis TaxID=2966451 RepID=UPI00214889B6|nr:insulinase family protein [Geothrix fuzhouensis]